MEDESRTADGRRRWQHWTEEQARAALEELAQSGMSTAKFAESKGVSAQRVAYWKKRLVETAKLGGTDPATYLREAALADARDEVLLPSERAHEEALTIARA